MVLLLGLLLGAIFQVRQAAITVSTKNQLHQIGLAAHNFAATNGDALPTLDGNPRGPTPDFSVLNSLLPYVEQAGQARNPLQPVSSFISPADPTIPGSPHRGAGLSSYAANGEVFLNPSRIPESFSDGTSSTILFGEHYAWDCQQMCFYFGMTIYSMERRASFADDGDIRPVTSGSPPVSGPSLFRLTFQPTPPKALCNPLLAQGLHKGGMLVSLGDGAVKMIAPTIDMHIYWGLVTPSSGEIVPEL